MPALSHFFRRRTAMPPLDPAPRILLEPKEDLSPPQEPGFVPLGATTLGRVLSGRQPERSVRLRHCRAQGTGRGGHGRALPAKMAGAKSTCGAPVRPPLAMRGPGRLPLSPAAQHGWLWELPAGLGRARGGKRHRPAPGRPARARGGARLSGGAGRAASTRPEHLFPHPVWSASSTSTSRSKWIQRAARLRRSTARRSNTAARCSRSVWTKHSSAAKRGEIADGKSELALRRLRERLA